MAATGLQVAAILRGQEVGHEPFDDPQAVLRQREIADDFRIEQRDRVRRDRIAEAGMEFLSDRGASHDAAPFEHGYFESARCQIGGADEAIVATADDQRITPGGCRHVSFLLKHGWAAPLEPARAASSSPWAEP